MTMPTLVYDGDCAACTRLAHRAASLRPDARVIAWQSADLQHLNLTEEECRAAVQWCEPGAPALSGAAAVAACFRGARQPWRLCGHLLTLPGMRWLAARGYAVIARNRHLLPGGTAQCALPGETPVDGRSPLVNQEAVGAGERPGAEESAIR